MKEEHLELKLPRIRAVLLSETPEQAGADLKIEIDVEAFIGYSPWETRKPPPMAGWWDITDHKTGARNARWWFNGEQWHTYAGSLCDHASFSLMYAWRGLRYPHPDEVVGPRLKKRGAILLPIDVAPEGV